MIIDPNSATGDGMIHWLLSAALTILASERAWMHYRARFGHGRRNGMGAFDKPDEYWGRMRETLKESVAQPLAEVLERQTKVMEKQIEGNQEVMQSLIRLDERTKRR